jgi:hypothetical protein
MQSDYQPASRLAHINTLGERLGYCDGGSFALTLKKPVGTLSPTTSLPFVLRFRGGYAETLSA